MRTQERHDRFITKQQYQQQKSALTRARNSGDPLQVLRACEKALAQWEDKCWPDDWSRWSVELYDAWNKYERSLGYDANDKIIERFQAAYHTFG